jgi:glycine/D-amino acid oxidase-like deaminating enzyme/nitrite reductase/ring-hydroxylating ferredoxin subunit
MNRPQPPLSALSVQRLDTTSYWIGSTSLPRFPKLEDNVKVDVIVVGGGITGVTTAYLLKQAGHSVALVEREPLARIDTGHTTAHLTSVTDLRLFELNTTFGRDHARAVWDAGVAATDQIARLVAKEKIECGFEWVPGYLHAPLTGMEPEQEDEIEREIAAAKELEIAAEFVEKVPHFDLKGVRFPHQAIFHPLRYLAALAKKIPGDGSHVFENSPVEEVENDPLAVRCGDYRVRGNYLVLATHTPLMGNTGMASALLFQTKLTYFTSYAMAARIKAGAVPAATFWDLSDPYYYLRVERRRGFDYAIFGGEDHKTGQVVDTEALYARLEERMRAVLPVEKVEYRWSGQVIDTNDGLPFIGETAERQFASSGFAGNGMTFGTLAGMMAVDAVAGRKNPWQELFSPDRKKLWGGTWNYLKQNKDYPFYRLRDWLGGAEGSSLREVKPNQGKILQLGGKKVAAYRDGDGKVTLCSPVCTHLQCIVAWNQAEQTWDCPCHGSRFKPGGEVISGPAEAPLEKLTSPESE